MKKRIPINTDNSIYIVVPEDLMYCKCNGLSTMLCLIDSETVIISKGLDAIEKLLEGNAFIRVHPNYLVNRNHIALVDIAHDYNLVLTNQEKIPTDETRLNEIMEFIQIGI